MASIHAFQPSLPSMIILDDFSTYLRSSTMGATTVNQAKTDFIHFMMALIIDGISAINQASIPSSVKLLIIDENHDHYFIQSCMRHLHGYITIESNPSNYNSATTKKYQVKLTTKTKTSNVPVQTLHHIANLTSRQYPIPNRPHLISMTMSLIPSFT